LIIYYLLGYLEEKKETKATEGRRKGGEKRIRGQREIGDNALSAALEHKT